MPGGIPNSDQAMLGSDQKGGVQRSRERRAIHQPVPPRATSEDGEAHTSGLGGGQARRLARTVTHRVTTPPRARSSGPPCVCQPGSVARRRFSIAVVMLAALLTGLVSAGCGQDGAVNADRSRTASLQRTHGATGRAARRPSGYVGRSDGGGPPERPTSRPAHPSPPRPCSTPARLRNSSPRLRFCSSKATGVSGGRIAWRTTSADYRPGHTG